MKVKFLKDHPSGIGKDSVIKFEDAHGKRLIEEDYAEEVDAKTGYVRKDAKILEPEKKKPKAKAKKGVAK